ncbi:MAG: DUF2059 domain-containing protein [Hyphomicrobiaceae bacterium]
MKKTHGRTVTKTARLAGAGLLLAAMLAACPLSAQEQKSEPDAARIAAARELLAAIGGTEQAKATVESLKQALIANMRASEPAKAVGFAAYAEAATKHDGPIVSKYLADIDSLAVNFYARRFSAEEMAAIAAFQKSEAGRKFQALTPELGSQIAARSMQLQADVLRAVEKGAAGAQPQ